MACSYWINPLLLLLNTDQIRFKFQKLCLLIFKEKSDGVKKSDEPWKVFAKLCKLFDSRCLQIPP